MATIGERLIAAGTKASSKIHGQWLTIGSNNIRVFAVGFEIASEINPETEVYDVRQATYFHFNRPLLFGLQETLIAANGTQWRTLKIVDHPLQDTLKVEVEKLP